MKKLLFTALALTALTLGNAQNILYVKDAVPGTPTLYIEPGAQMYVFGDIEVTGTGGGSTDYLRNNGTLVLDQDFLFSSSNLKNTTGSPIQIYTGNQGTFTLGSSLVSQEVMGNAPITFWNFTTLPNADFDIDMTVNGQLNDNGKIIEMKGRNVNYNGTYIGNGFISPDANTYLTIGGSGAWNNLRFVPNDNFIGTLHINRAGTVTLGNQANIEKALNLQAGTINTGANLAVIRSQASGTAYINNFSSGYNGTLTGTVTMERYNGGATGFHYISIPTTTASINDFTEIVTPNSNLDGIQITPAPGCPSTHISPYSVYGNMMEWREAGPFSQPGCTQDGWYVRYDGFFNTGRGYLARMANGSKIDIKAAPYLNNTFSSSTLLNSGGQGNGWQLVGNPYCAPIEWPGVVGMGDVNLFNTTGNHVGTYSQITLALPVTQRYMSSMQGFFSKVQGGSATFTIPGSARRALNNVNFVSDPLTFPNIDVNISGNGFGDRTRIFFLPGATANYDELFDARKLPGRDDQPIIFTHLPNGSEQLGINTFDELVEPYAVPMVMKPGQNGQFTFSFNEMSSLDPSTMVYLEDLQTGDLQDLRLSNEYSFSSNVTDNPERFLIRFEPPVQVDAANQTCEALGSLELNQAGNTVWANYVVKDYDGNIYAQGANFSGELTIEGLPAQEYIITLTHTSGYVAEEYVLVGGVQGLEAELNADAVVTTVDEPVTFTATANGATNYTWNFGDGNTLNAGATVQHSYETAGTYNVTVTASNGTCQDASTKTIVVNNSNVTSVNTAEAGNVNIFAVGNKVTIDFNNWGGEKGKVRIFNLAGQEVQVIDDVNTLVGRQEVTLNVAPGYYVVQVVSGNKVVNRKLMLGASSN